MKNTLKEYGNVLIPDKSQLYVHRERWGAGVETHFQEI